MVCLCEVGSGLGVGDGLEIRGGEGIQTEKNQIRPVVSG
jgi:hypothetical protein